MSHTLIKHNDGKSLSGKIPDLAGRIAKPILIGDSGLRKRRSWNCLLFVFVARRKSVFNYQLIYLLSVTI